MSLDDVKTHSWLSPSGLKPIIDGCVGKPFMEKHFPKKPAGPAALRGTRIHEIAEKLLLDDDVTFDPVPDDDLLEIATQYVSYCLDIFKEMQRTPHSSLHVEEKVTVFKELQIEGTGDCFIWSPIGVLHLIDLKTGRTPVIAEENIQLLTYAWGFLQKYPSLICKKVVLHVFQPGNVQKSWELTYAELEAKISVIKSYCQTAYELYHRGTVIDPKTHLKVNDSCQYCLARGICPEFRRHLREQTLVLLDDNPVGIPIVRELTLEQRSRIMAAKPLIESYLEEVESAVRRDLEAGLDVPGLMLVPGKKIRNWNEDFDVASALLHLGVEPYRQSLITIGDAEKQLKKQKSLIPKDAFKLVEQRQKIVVKDSNLLDLLEDIEND